MTEVSVKDQIKKLVDIQKIDEEIYSLKKDIKERPLIIEELKEEFEASKGELNQLEGNFKTIQLARKDKEMQLKEKEGSIAKFNTQLSDIKTNKEYQAKISEIEHMKADISIVEEKILISYDEGDAVTKEIDNEKVCVARKEKEFLDRKKEIENEVKVKEDQVKVFEGQRNQILPEIDRNYLSQYEKILQHKEGIALVPVQGTMCGGCFMNLNPQVVNALKMQDQIISCERCSRLLYLEDDD